MATVSTHPRGSASEVFRAALVLGLTSFGGPVAHLGYFEREYVERRGWLSRARYLELVTLCQLLPGPASSQVGIAIGLLRAGFAGAGAAWLGFTLPSAALLTAFALLTTDVALGGMGWVHGLKLAAVAIVAAAIASMWRSVAPDWPRRLLAVLAAALMLAIASPTLQAAVIAAGGLGGWLLLRKLPAPEGTEAPSPVGRGAGIAAAATFGVLLLVLPVLATATGNHAIAVVDAFYRAGALVFGGGHVVLPLLSESVVEPGWLDRDTFLAGYGAAQAVPGPLFSVSAHLGASLRPEPNEIAGAAIALGAIFLPSFLLVAAALPFWDQLRRSGSFRAALAGASAAVIGLLVAAFVDPLWTSTITGPPDVVMAALAFAALVVARVPPWAVVVGLAVTAQAVALVGAG